MRACGVFSHFFSIACVHCLFSANMHKKCLRSRHFSTFLLTILYGTAKHLCSLYLLSHMALSSSEHSNQSSLSLRSLVSSHQDSASLKVSSSCTPTDLMELAVRKWLTTHGSEEEAVRGQYVLRVSQCLEFLYGDHPLIQYKVSVSTGRQNVLKKSLAKSVSKQDIGRRLGLNRTGCGTAIIIDR